MVHPFRKFLAVLPPPTLYKVETRKKFWIQASNIVCGVRGGVGLVWIGKRPRNENGSQDFCPWLCLHQKLQSVTPLNWTCIATFLVNNVKLWSNFRNVFSGLGYSSTKFIQGGSTSRSNSLPLFFIIYTIFHTKGNPSVHLLLTNGIPSLSLDIPEAWRSLTT